MIKGRLTILVKKNTWIVFVIAFRPSFNRVILSCIQNVIVHLTGENVVDKPNILFIFTDDQAYHTHSCPGRK